MGRKEAHKADKLTFQHSPKSLPNTKRGILSLVACSFDPLGNCNTGGFRGETYNSVFMETKGRLGRSYSQRYITTLPTMIK